MGLSARYPHALARTRRPDIYGEMGRQVYHRAARDSAGQHRDSVSGVGVPAVSQGFLGKPNEQGQQDRLYDTNSRCTVSVWLPDSPITARGIVITV